MKILLLDADSVAYSLGFMSDANNLGLKETRRTLAGMFDRYYEDTGCFDIKVYLGTSSNYRKQIATYLPYKGNRKGVEKPKFHKQIREWLIKYYEAELVAEQEAEDAVGIEAYTYNDYNDYIVGAIDKDMKMIAGNHYNYKNYKQYFINKYEALRNFYLQLVTGDKSTDNIPGLLHILQYLNEEALAKKFRYSRYKSKLIKDLAKVDTELAMWEIVYNLYDEWINLAKTGLEPIIEIGRLLWIRRYPDELWVPPTQRDFNYIDTDSRN